VDFSPGTARHSAEWQVAGNKSERDLMIHHYTSVPTLACILKSSTIRFSRFDGRPRASARNLRGAIHPDALGTMVVTLGPLSKDADSIVVSSLLKRYAPTARLQNSSLRGAIRSR
jgi:hypothetical protein